MEHDTLMEILDETNDFSNVALEFDGLSPIEVKIKKLRITLKELNARIVYLKSMSKENRSSEISEEDLDSINDKLNEDIVPHNIINDKGLSMSLETEAIEKIFSNQENEEFQEKFNNLYSLDENLLKVQNEIKNMMVKLHHLKNKDKEEAQNYQDFLKEQEELRVEELQQSNPLIAQYKEKMESTIQKINMMKKLTVKFISGSNLLSEDEPFLLEMLKSHRNLVTSESISNMIANEKNSTEE